MPDLKTRISKLEKNIKPNKKLYKRFIGMRALLLANIGLKPKKSKAYVGANSR